MNIIFNNIIFTNIIFIKIIFNKYTQKMEVMEMVIKRGKRLYLEIYSS